MSNVSESGQKYKNLLSKAALATYWMFGLGWILFTLYAVYSLGFQFSIWDLWPSIELFIYAAALVVATKAGTSGRAIFIHLPLLVLVLECSIDFFSGRSEGAAELTPAGTVGVKMDQCDYARGWWHFGPISFGEKLEPIPPVSFSEAYKSCYELAESGNAKAADMIGYLYAMGIDIHDDPYKREDQPNKIDYESAYFWLSIAAKTDFLKYETRPEYYASKLTPEQIKRIQKQVAEWKPKPPSASH